MSRRPVTMTVRELAEWINVSEPTAYGLVRSGAVPAVRVGDRWLVSRRGVRRWLETGTGSAVADPVPRRRTGAEAVESSALRQRYTGAESGGKGTG